MGSLNKVVTHATTMKKMLALTFLVYAFLTSFGVAQKRECGKRGIQVTDQFVADQDFNVAIKDYPWSVAIIKETSENNFIIQCSGSILNNRWILTAGHCFDDFKENARSKLKIKLGTDDWSQEYHPFENPKLQDHELENFFVHPKYSKSQHYYDVALIETQDEIFFDG